VWILPQEQIIYRGQTEDISDHKGIDTQKEWRVEKRSLLNKARRKICREREVEEGIAILERQTERVQKKNDNYMQER